MLSTKKLLYKILESLQNKLTTDSFKAAALTSSTVTVTANNSTSAVIPFPSAYPREDYRCMAISDISFQGGTSGNWVLRGFGISNGGGTVSVHIRSLSSSQTTGTVQVYALFLKK